MLGIVTESPPAASSPAPIGILLRSSCDSCTIAKVKCDKTQPKCHRCAVSNFSCSYSPSRRTRKPTESRGIVKGRYNRRFNTSAISPLSTSHIERPVQPNFDGFTQDDATQRISAELPLQTSQAQWPDFFGPTDFQYSVTTPHVHPHLNPQDGHRSMQISHRSPNPASPCPITGTFASAIPVANFGGFFDTVNSNVIETDGNISTSTASLGVVQASEAPEGFDTSIHDCEGRAMSTLHSLYFRTMVQANVAGQNTLNETVNTMPNLDRLLQTNKAAIASLSKLLDCRCALQDHLSLLYISILSKVLFWYDLAVSGRPGDSPREVPNVDGICALTKITPDGHGVKMSRVNLGTFDLEEDHQDCIIKTVILREVSKVKTLIDRMGELDNTSQSDENGDRFSTAWYGVALEKIKADFQRTLRRINEAGGTQTI